MIGKRSVYFKREDSKNVPSKVAKSKTSVAKNPTSKNSLSKKKKKPATLKLGKTVSSNATLTKSLSKPSATKSKNTLSKGETLSKSKLSKTVSGTPLKRTASGATSGTTSKGTPSKGTPSKGTPSTTNRTPSKTTLSAEALHKTPETRSKRRRRRRYVPLTGRDLFDDDSDKDAPLCEIPWKKELLNYMREQRRLKVAKAKAKGPTSKNNEELSSEIDEKEYEDGINFMYVNRQKKLSNEKELVEIITDDIGRFDTNVDNLYYFHGFLAREEAEALLDEEGDFLIREAEHNRTNHYVISVMHKKEVHHVLVKTTKSRKLYWTYKYAFKSIVELAIYHVRLGVAVYADLVLITGIGKHGWQINHEQIDLKTKLGEGQFGEVWRGIMKTNVTRSGVLVAVKKLTGYQLSGKQKSEFLQEARLMLSLRHPNVARLYGVCTMRHPIMLVLEFCEKGALDSILKSANKLTTEQKITYLYHAACGLRYIHSKAIIHRDIAARNCLVTSKDVVKISDFGLSHKGLSVTERKGGNTPYKYMAPEAIKPGTHSPASDMFSYTALMYEMMTDGQIPFEDEKHKRIPIKKLILMLRDFKAVLEFNPPPDTPAYIFKIFNNCRVKEPAKRLTALEVVTILEEEGGCIEVKPDSWMHKTFERFCNFFKNISC